MAVHVSVNFVRDERIFRKTLPLLENARWAKRNGLLGDARLEYLFLHGMGKLNRDHVDGGRYIEEIEACGVHVRNVADLYGDLAKRYAKLRERHTGFFNFFIRWIVIKELYDDDALFCYDGDIMLNVPLETLESEFAGFTGTVTSTCFAAIHDRSWLDSFEEHLDSYNDDPAAFIERFVPGDTFDDKQRYFDSQPEEAFSRALVDHGAIRQDYWGDDFSLSVFPQPQWLPRRFTYFVPPGAGARELPTPLRYERIASCDHISGKPVAFWHLQKGFLSMLGAYLFLEKHCELETINGLEPFFSTYEMFPYVKQKNLAKALMFIRENDDLLFGDLYRSPFGIPQIYSRFFENGDMGGLLCDAGWHVENVWESREGAA